MATANENIRDAMNRHLIGVIRASGTLTRKMIALLRRTEKELRKKINQRLKGIKERGVDLGPETTTRLLDLESEIRDILKIPQREISGEVDAFLTDLARREPVFIKNVIASELPVVINFGLPPTRQLREIVRGQPIDGRLLGDWIEEFHEDDIKRMIEEIRRGLTLGESTQQIARRIFSTAGQGGARKVTRREAEAIARTTANAIANKARQAFFIENKRFIRLEVWLATLDSRTCPQCGRLDGRRFKVGDPSTPSLTTVAGGATVATFSHNRGSEETPDPDGSWDNLTERVENIQSQAYSVIGDAANTGTSFDPDITTSDLTSVSHYIGMSLRAA